MRTIDCRSISLAFLMSIPLLCLVPLQVAANPVPVGACCLADQCQCQLLDQRTCEAAGGAYLGDGTPCDPDPCSFPLGACCFPDGHCTVLCLADCMAQGGTFMQYGLPCEPNPCPPCLVPCSSACCFPDGHCESLDQARCESRQGIYQGSNTTCYPNPCPPSAVPGPNRGEDRNWGQIKHRYR